MADEVRGLKRLLRCVASWGFLLVSGIVAAQTPEIHPLAPADTSSPRATLRSFLTAVDSGLAVELRITRSYLSSDRLYTNGVENALRNDSDRFFERALETLDLSRLPPGFRNVLAVDRLIRLSEVLARIDLPSEPS